MEKPSSGSSLTSPDLTGILDLISQAADVGHLQHIMRDAIRPLIVAEGVTLILRRGAFCYYAAEDAIKPLWLGRKFPMETCISGWSMSKQQTVCVPDIHWTIAFAEICTTLPL